MILKHDGNLRTLPYTWQSWHIGPPGLYRLKNHSYLWATTPRWSKEQAVFFALWRRKWVGILAVCEFYFVRCLLSEGQKLSPASCGDVSRPLRVVINWENRPEEVGEKGRFPQSRTVQKYKEKQILGMESRLKCPQKWIRIEKILLQIKEMGNNLYR